MYLAFFMQVAPVDPIIVPFIVAMVGVTVAILERGWNEYKNEKLVNPNIKFEAAYVWNIVASGGGVAVILGIVGAIIGALTSGELSLGLTLVSVVAQVSFGYLATYRFLDGMNKSTDRKLAAAKSAPQG